MSTLMIRHKFGSDKGFKGFSKNNKLLNYSVILPPLRLLRLISLYNKTRHSYTCCV